jgi:hypothetical protein
MPFSLMKTFVEWQVAPTGDPVKGGTRESVILGYPAGSMVELFHPDHDADVIGKGRCGKECTADGIADEYRSMGAQAVTITECLKEGVPVLVDVHNEPRVENLDDAVGYQILWPVMYLQQVLRVT